MDVYEPTWALETIDERFEARLQIRDGDGRALANLSFDSEQLSHLAQAAMSVANWLLALEYQKPRHLQGTIIDWNI